MKEYGRRRMRYLKGIVWAGILSLCFFRRPAQQCALGQTSASPQLLEQKAVAPVDAFHADLEMLSRRFGIAFIAEGQPFPPAPLKSAPSLSKNLSQEDAVHEVAAYFDYSVARQDGIYLLTKRYTSAEDLPETSPEECRHGLKTIARLLEPFNPKFPPPTYFGSPRAKIALLFSADQLDRLSKDGIPASELTQEQRAEAWRLALYFYIQPQVEEAERIIEELETRNPADPSFHWQTVLDIHAFGYDTRSEALNKALFIPVSDSNRIRIAPNGATSQRAGYYMLNGVRVTQPDPTDPTNISEALKSFLDANRVSAHSKSLSEVIAALNARSAGHPVYKIDPAYAARHVILAGTDSLSAESVLNALATIYGLQLAHNQDGSFELTHRPAAEVKQLADLGTALHHAVPATIYRAMTGGMADVSPKGQDTPGALAQRPYQDFGIRLSTSAMRAFRYLAEPQVKSQPKGRLPLSRLGERARSLFEFAPTAPFYAKICWLADRKIPPYIADFDHITLTGGISRNEEGQERFALYLSYVDPITHEKRQGPGFSNAIIPH